MGDLERSGRPRGIDDLAVVVATLAAPPAHLGVTYGSARLLAKEMGISFASVARIWRDNDLKPWKRQTFKFSTDPELDAKVRDVVGLLAQALLELIARPCRLFGGDEQQQGRARQILADDPRHTQTEASPRTAAPRPPRSPGAAVSPVLE